MSSLKFEFTTQKNRVGKISLPLIQICLQNSNGMENCLQNE